MTTAPPGWHPDPHDPSRQRWWDGTQWTDHTAPGPAAAPPQPPQPAAPPQPVPPAPPSAPQVVQYPTPVPVGDGGVPRASYMARVGGALIDWFLGWGVYVVIFIATWGSTRTYRVPSCSSYNGGGFYTCVNGKVTEWSPSPLLLVGLLVALVVMILNKGIKQGASGLTVGKSVTGIALVRADTLQPPGAGRGIGRAVVFYVFTTFTCGIFGLLDVLWPLWDPRGQRIVDKMFSTRVIAKGLVHPRTGA